MKLPPRVEKVYKALMLVISLYVFLISIKLMSSSFKLMGTGFSESILVATANPIAGLVIGMLATALMQSSSSTTSMIVAMVGSGILPLSAAVPMVMGANIGTTVTNILVSMGHITRRGEFKRAFAGATVHDFFNLIAVGILLPIEYFTHFLERTATFLANGFVGTGGLEFASPLDYIVTPVTSKIVHLLPPTYMIIISIALLLIALKFLVTSTRFLFTAGISENFLSKYFFKAAIISFIFGLGLTALVQSSSITTSLVVPFVGAGMLSLEQVFPFMLGANIGTTITAILASLVSNSTAAVAVAFVHLLFNIIGIIIIYPIRRIPIGLAKKFGEFVSRHRSTAIIYLVIAFYVIPIIILILTGVIGG